MSKLKTIAAVLIIITFSFLLGCDSTEASIKNNTVFSDNSVIAHRGAWKKENLPQNSIAALRRAIELKCAGSEFDVRMTKDDSLIINHDSTYHNLYIEKTNFADLVAFKLSNGESIPTLREYLLTGNEKNNHSTRLVCEIKPSKISEERGVAIATKVVQLVTELNVQDLVVYISFDYDILKKIKALDPHAITQYLGGDKSPILLSTDGVDGADFHISVFKNHSDWIEDARENGVILNAWTVNEDYDMDWLLANNFDFITTDYPELLLEKINQIAKSNETYQLVWSDEFEYNGLPDSTKWNYEVGGNGWGNNEKQFYTEKTIENSYVNEGILHIIALEKKYENLNYTSSRLTTYQRFSLQYGKIEVMAKLPQGTGTWPAIWMLPVSLRQKIESWPLSGEIDIMEHVGKDPNVVHVSLHTELYNFWKKNQYTHFDKLHDVTNTFHLYSIEWTTYGIKFFIDNILFYKTIKGQNGKEVNNEGWPFDKPYFLILNLAIGGNWGGEIDNAIFPAEMQIDYVRMYQKNIG